MPKQLLIVAQTGSKVHKVDLQLCKGKKVSEIYLKWQPS